MVSCGLKHFIIASENDVYSWGDSTHFQLGHGTTYNTQFPTRIISFRRKIVNKIAAGAYHTLLLTDQQEVYSWGHGVNGQLGNGFIGDKGTPQVIEKLKGCGSYIIAGGYSHSIVVGTDVSTIK